MLIQEYRLWELTVRVYSRVQEGREWIRVMVMRGDSGGMAQMELPKDSSPEDRERFIEFITATSIRKICAMLDKTERKDKNETGNETPDPPGDDGGGF